jgi:thiamine-monophosphate kinase
MSEFDLIKRFFTRTTPGAVLGVGDDAALLRVGSGMELAVSTDMLVGGTHFLPDADPFLLGHKTLAVNLSDLAAMGAQPRWATLALSLPYADEAWLQKFSEGFFALADQYGVELVGGDTTRGPLNLCVTVMGEIPQGAALRRSGAQAGDDIWVSGRLGDAALALAHLQGKVQLSAADFSSCASALHQPMPRVALGLALRGVAHSAIDVSDGLLADLGHVLESSQAGAEVLFDRLPVSSSLRSYLAQAMGTHCILAGGDDYELCFTAPAAHRSAVETISHRLNLPLTRIGAIVSGNGCTVRAADGSTINIGESGYDHFR